MKVITVNRIVVIFVITIFLFFAGVILFRVFKENSKSYQAHSVLNLLYRISNDQDVIKYRKGEIPRTEKDLCQAWFHAHAAPNGSSPASCYSDIDPRMKGWDIKVTWTPNEAHNIAFIKNAKHIYVLTVNGEIIKRQQE